MRTRTVEVWRYKNRLTAAKTVMRGTKRFLYLIVSMGILLLTLLVTSCSPGPGVYEGPLKEKTSIVLPEGEE